MAESRVKQLYRRIGPVLYARAQRVIQDPRVAEELTKEVVVELAKLKASSDNELLKQGRARLAQLCKERGTGSVLDSMQPGNAPKR